LLGQAGFSGIHSSFYTYGIAACLGCLVFAKHWRGLLLQPKSILWLVLAAGWTNLSYVLAVIEGEVMRVMLLFYLSPVWTLLLAHFWLKERAGIKGVVVVVISLLGAFIMLYTPEKPSHLPLPHNLSEWLALSSGMGFALTNVITRKSTHLSLVTKSFAVWIGVIFMSLISMLMLGGSMVSPSDFLLKDWMLVVLIALMLFASTLFVQYGVTHIAAVRASIIFLFELLVAAVAAYYLANEAMTLNEWVGGLFIVLAAIYSTTSYAD
jgi:drug/metabolite transporter (DMT)-like permease